MQTIEREYTIKTINEGIENGNIVFNHIDGYKASMVKNTSYKGLWKVSFTLKEF